MKSWTEKEVDFLKGNYIRFTYNELANNLNRTKKQIEYKLNKLKLKRKYNISHSRIMKDYFNKNVHHMKGTPKSKEQKKKMSEARKNYLKRTNQNILNEVYKKMSKTKRKKGVHLGEKNLMYGKKRLDLSKRNKENWKKEDFRLKMKNILIKINLEGSKKQKELYYFLIKNFGNKNILYNDWDSLNNRYEIDISIPSKKIAIEWDGYYWHYQNGKNIKQDLLKNRLILEKGWKFIRIKDDHLNKSEIKQIYKDVMYLINNINIPQFKYTGGFYLE